MQVPVRHLRRQRGGVEHLLFVIFFQTWTRFMQAVQRRRNAGRVAEEFTPELNAHLVTEFRNLFQLTGIALSHADQLRGAQGDKLMLRHRKLTEAQRRTHTKRAPVRRTAIERWGQIKLFFKGAGERLLGIEAILQRDVEDRTCGQP